MIQCRIQITKTACSIPYWGYIDGIPFQEGVSITAIKTTACLLKLSDFFQWHVSNTIHIKYGLCGMA